MVAFVADLTADSLVATVPTASADFVTMVSLPVFATMVPVLAMA